MRKYKLNIGGGITHFNYLLDYHNYLQNFYDIKEVFFDSVYDSIYGLHWNGGRQLRPLDITVEELIKRVRFFNELGIGFNFTFSRNNLTEYDLRDEYCNYILKNTESDINGIIYTSKNINEYIKSKYGKFKLVYSACADITSVQEYNDLTETNDKVVMSPDFNHNIDFLKEIEKKEKIEIILNEPCITSCPFRKKHYQDIDRANKKLSEKGLYLTEQEKGAGACLAEKNGYVKDGGNIIKFTEMDKLMEMGFINFKLVGREYSWNRLYQDLRDYLERKWIHKILIEQGVKK